MNSLTYEEYVNFVAELKVENKEVPWYASEWQEVLNRMLGWPLQRQFEFHDAVYKRMKELTESYQYMVTFTVDPKKHSNPDESKIEIYLDSQIDRPALHILKCSYVKEYTKKGMPHWHMKLNTSKPLRSDAFAQYKKVYGSVDISRSKHTNGQHTDIYMNKEGSIKVLK